MKNAQLDAARAYLIREGYDDLPDKVVLGIFAVMVCQDATVYEPGDFIGYNEGMGEYWYGTVIDSTANGYRIETWTHDPEAYPSYIRSVHATDVRELSTPDAALNYYYVRRGGNHE